MSSEIIEITEGTSEMSYEQLREAMADIELRKHSDLRAVITLLNVIHK